MQTIYLRPAGLTFSDSAREAVKAGAAGPLAGGSVAFSLVEIIERDGARVSRSWRAWRDLSLSSDKDMSSRLQRLTGIRAPIAGLALERTRVMGIVNVTPDSFSDGGQFGGAGDAIAHGRALIAAGADLLDIGGESTRPGSDPVDLETERARVLPVISALSDDGHAVSTDTRKAQLMREAAAAGARLINDVSALDHDRDALATAAELKLPVCLMHAQGDPKTMQDDPRYDDVVLDVHDWLEARIGRCVAAGVHRSAIIADPGIGFGKTLQHNLQLIERFSIFHGLGVALMLGASRKAFIGKLTGEPVAGNRVTGSVAAALAGAMQMAHFVRVHDVRETVQALKVWQAGVSGDIEGAQP